MTTRRDLWYVIARKNGFSPGSAEEKAFIESHFSIGPATFDSNLSRGFARRHVPALREVCGLNRLPFDPDLWCVPPKPDWLQEVGERIAWAGEPITGVQEFYDQLANLYVSATYYQVLRVGGIFSRNRTSFDFGADRLAKAPMLASIRVPYLQIFWRRLKEGRLSGTSVHVVRTLDRLAELWACAELLGKLGLSETNRVYMAPLPLGDLRQEIPAVGMRVIDHDKTLLSLPALMHGNSHYSSWVESSRLAGFAEEYVERVKIISDDLTRETKVGLEAIMHRSFGFLTHTASGNYGILDSFDKVKVVKDRMLKWAGKRDGLWLPVIG